jgi:hypothetical protein
MDILNFISWIKAKRVTTTPPDGSLIAVGVPSKKRDDKYLTVAMTLNDAVAAGCQANSTYKTGIFDDFPWYITPSMLSTCTRIENAPTSFPAFEENLVGYKVGGSYALDESNTIVVEYIGTIKSTDGSSLFRFPWKTSGTVGAFVNVPLPSPFTSAFANGAFITDSNGDAAPAELMTIALDLYSLDAFDLYLIVSSSTAVDTMEALISFEYEFLEIEGQPIKFTIY